MTLHLPAPDAFPRAFGFVVFRDPVAAVEVEQRPTEADDAIRTRPGPGIDTRTRGGGIAGHYVPTTSEYDSENA
jgi:hypothetical protein